MAQEFLDVFGVDTLDEQECGAGVALVVEAYPREPSSLQQGLKDFVLRFDVFMGVPVRVANTSP